MAMLADIPPVAGPLGRVVPAQPLAWEALTVIPLLLDGAQEPDWLTLAEAGQEVTITEISEDAEIGALRVTNGAGRPLLLLDGEVVTGGRQNRALNTTVLVPAGATLAIPVSCVEQGRSGWRQPRLVPADAALFASLRRRQAARVSEALARGRGHQGDQRGVWDVIAGRLAEHGVPSPTADLAAVYAHLAGSLAAPRRLLGAQPGQAGALVFLAGQWVGLDLLAAPGLFARAWNRLCLGYVADAIGLAPDPGVPVAAQPILERLARCPVAPAPGLGLGTEYRLGGEAAGAALVHADCLVHLMAFPAPLGR